jgi:hypothetical protein
MALYLTKDRTVQNVELLNFKARDKYSSHRPRVVRAPDKSKVKLTL